MCHRRRHQRPERGEGTRRRRRPLRVLRELGPDRGQLGLRQPQRALQRVPLAAHRHVQGPRVLPRLPDGRVVPGLPAPLPDQGVPGAVRASSSGSRSTSLSRPASTAPGGWRAAAGRSTPPTARPAASTRWWWATATTGTPGCRTSPASSAASRSTRTRTSHPPSLLPLRDKRILVVGIGNSAADITSELSQKTLGNRVTISTRSGAWVVPKYAFGRPSDRVGKTSALRPAELAAPAGARPAPADLGPDRRTTGCPRPTTTSWRPIRRCPASCCCGWGRATRTRSRTCPGSMGRPLHFADGTSDEFDAIVYATGYNITFPFFDESFLSAPDNRFPLYKRVFKPGIDDLAFVGFAQALPTLFPFVEWQARLVAGYLGGRYRPPSPAPDGAHDRPRAEALHGPLQLPPRATPSRSSSSPMSATWSAANCRRGPSAWCVTGRSGWLEPSARSWPATRSNSAYPPLWGKSVSHDLDPRGMKVHAQAIAPDRRPGGSRGRFHHAARHVQRPPQRDPNEQAKTYVTIDYGPAKEAGRTLVFLGRVYSKKAHVYLHDRPQAGALPHGQQWLRHLPGRRVGTVGIRKRIKDPTLLRPQGGNQLAHLRPVSRQVLRQGPGHREVRGGPRAGSSMPNSIRSPTTRTRFIWRCPGLTRARPAARPAADRSRSSPTPCLSRACRRALRWCGRPTPS